MPSPPVVALEIGTSKVVALVAELREDGRITVTGLGEHESKGVRKGEIVDLENATICLRGALHAAEENGQVTIREVHLAISGGHIQSQVNRGTTPITDPGGEIAPADIEQVKDLARAISLPSDREMLHTIWQRFCVDGGQYVTNPEGLVGSQLSLDMLALHGVRSRMANTVNVVQSIPMDVEDVAFSGLCSALSVLSPEQKEIGALLIDLGGGTTDYVAYANRTLAASGVLGVGGDHITNDIALAFGIPVKRADALKLESGSAIVDKSTRSHRVDVPMDVGFPERSISVLGLQTVINARAEEMLQMIKARLDPLGITHHFGAGIILTGGGSQLRGMRELAKEVFRVPCTIGVPRDVDGLVSATGGPQYATAIGMARYGFQAERSDAPSLWQELVKRVWRRNG